MEEKGLYKAYAVGEGARPDGPLPTPPRGGPRRESARPPTPREEVLSRLRGAIPPADLESVPRKWEKLGDVLVLRLPERLEPHAGAVAEAFAHVLRVRCVLADGAGVGGELREMSARILRGSDPVTTHVENGLRYRFDASRVMFSSGNVAERVAAATLPARGETVVDMFAGIGYFAIPIAARTAAARVIAIEKNPVSHAYLVENARLNGVEDVLEPWLGDNRTAPFHGLADRVLMGYFPGTEAFLPRAMELLKPGGGIVHYHETCPADKWRTQTPARVLAAAQRAGRAADLLEVRRVKNYAPGIVHATAVARVHASGALAAARARSAERTP